VFCDPPLGKAEEALQITELSFGKGWCDGKKIKLHEEISDVSKTPS